MDFEPIKDVQDFKLLYEGLVAKGKVVVAEFLMIGCNVPLNYNDLIKLKFEDVDGGSVLCRSRNHKKSTVVNINKRCDGAIARLRGFYVERGVEPTYLFRSTSNRVKNLDQPLTVQWFGKEAREVAVELGVNIKLAPSTLRKTYAYHAFVNGVDINDLQQMFLYDGRRQVLKLVGGEDYRNVDTQKDDELERMRERSLMANKKLTYDWNFPPLSDPWPQSELEYPDYDEGGIPRDAFLRDVFLDETEVSRIMERLEYKKNIVLQGAPGVGKTFVAKRIAKAFMRSDSDRRIETVQFHQTYSYEDFVQGYRPSGSGFTLKNGVFYEFVSRARNDPDKSYFFIVDEMNRGNLSKIFGELLMLLEADKRGEDWAIPLAYSSEEKFYIPDNLYFIGLMNTADRSLSVIDYALRRRFSFITLEPKFGSDQFFDFVSSLGVDESVISEFNNKMISLNERISADIENLGPGFCIGHSFFCSAGGGDNWVDNIINFEIMPLVEEYWFDDPSTVSSIREELLA